MAKYLIMHDRSGCIGCGACAAIASDFWEMGADGKSNIKGGKKLEDGKEEKEIDEQDFAANKEAADSCPVNVIHITDKKKNEQII